MLKVEAIIQKALKFDELKEYRKFQKNCVNFSLSLNFPMREFYEFRSRDELNEFLDLCDKLKIVCCL